MLLKEQSKGNNSDSMSYSYDSFVLHSILLQYTEILSFKSVGLEMTKVYSGQRTGNRPRAIGDPIIRPIFDRRMKINTNLSQFCSLETISIILQNMWKNERPHC